MIKALNINNAFTIDRFRVVMYFIDIDEGNIYKGCTSQTNYQNISIIYYDEANLKLICNLFVALPVARE